MTEAAKPWEKYGGTATAEPAKPWEKYANVVPISGPGRGGRRPTQEQLDASHKLAQDRPEQLGYGAPTLMTGVEELTNMGDTRGPGKKLRGLHNVLTGTAELAAPLAAEAVIAAPAAAAGTAAIGYMGGKMARGGAKLAGVQDPNKLDLIEDAGMYGSGAAGSLPGVRRAAGELVPKSLRALGGRMAEQYRGPQPKSSPGPPEGHADLSSGKTFPVREKLRDLGGQWDKERKVWTVPKDKLQKAQDIVANVPEIKVTSEGYRARGERSPEDLGKIPGDNPSRGPLQSPQSSADAGKSAKADANAIAGVLKQHGITREDAAKMTETEWKLVFSNAGLKTMPANEVLKSALAALETNTPETPLALNVRRRVK